MSGLGFLSFLLAVSVPQTELSSSEKADLRLPATLFEKRLSLCHTSSLQRSGCEAALEYLEELASPLPSPSDAKAGAKGNAKPTETPEEEFRRLRAHLAGTKVREGDKERVQVFEGICIRRTQGGPQSTFTVRKSSYGVGVERIFPLHTPIIEKIEVVTRGDVRRAKLYYLRELRGKISTDDSVRDVRAAVRELARAGMTALNLEAVANEAGFAKLDPVVTAETLAVGAEAPPALAALPPPEPVHALALRVRDRKDEVRLSAALAKLADEVGAGGFSIDPDIAKVSVIGAGTIVLSGASSYAGATTVSSGLLAIAHATALGSVAGGTTVAQIVAIHRGDHDVFQAHGGDGLG